MLRDLNEAMVGEPEKVKSEKEELRGDEIKELRRRLWISPDDELCSISIVNYRSRDNLHVCSNGESAELEMRRSII